MMGNTIDPVEMLVMIGEGETKKVYADPLNPELVWAEFKIYLEDDQIKSLFYLNKIAHLLFPENVPDVRIVGNRRGEDFRNDPYDSHAYYVADRMQISSESRELGEILKLYYQTRSKEAEERAWAAERAIWSHPEVGRLYQDIVGSGIVTEPAGRNFSVKDGVATHFDLSPAWRDPYEPQEDVNASLWFDQKRLAAAIEFLPEDRKDIAKGYFSRLIFLYERSGPK